MYSDSHMQKKKNYARWPSGMLRALYFCLPARLNILCVDTTPTLLRHLRAGRITSGASLDAYPVASTYQGEMVNVALVVSALASLAFAAPYQPGAGVNYWFSLWVSLCVIPDVPHPISAAQWRFIYKHGLQGQRYAAVYRKPSRQPNLPSTFPLPCDRNALSQRRSRATRIPTGQIGSTL